VRAERRIVNVKLAVRTMTTGFYSEEHKGIYVCHTSLLIPLPRYAAPRVCILVAIATIFLGNTKSEVWWNVIWRVREIAGWK